MFNVEDFEKIRPYHDYEINMAMDRITKDPFFDKIASYVFPEKNLEEVKSIFLSINSADEFQLKFSHLAVRRVVELSSDGLTFEGFDKLDPLKPYLFIANHRDIVLDSAILQVLLVEHNIRTSEITFGSNLMNSPFIIDIGKVNKMFTVFRGGNRIELLNNSKLLSSYIRYAITEKHNSVWIAHRNGRTKDGNDKTEEALLKMLNLSGKQDIKNNFSELNIIPLTISYEYEPCGTLKVNELYQSLISEYKKAQGEDFNSIVKGFTQPKGRIHLCAGKLITTEFLNIDENKSYKENISIITKNIDNQIYKDYRLWKTNYIAYDVLANNTSSNEHYSIEDKEKFLLFVINEINKLEGDKLVLKEMYLKMYANPVMNFMKCT